MRVDQTRDDNLTEFGKATLRDRYLLPEETYQDLFARVAKFYADNDEHAQRLYDYMSKLWFMPATPILSNGGTDRGLAISCFLSEAGDSMESLQNVLTENWWLACKGGGIGSYYGNIRSIGERVKNNGKTSGVIPFLKIQDSQTLAVSQGSLRRGSAAVYLPIHHPEIEEFIDMRRPTGGDPNRKCLNLHHGVVIDDEFMTAVKLDLDYRLTSPKDGSTISTVKARALWTKLLTTRIETGEPYIMFGDTVSRAIPEHHKRLGLEVKMSNLCTEITLPTGKDHLGKERTAVCCLSSLNLEKFPEWATDPYFITDVMRFLDNVMTDFIENAPDTHAKAKYSAMRERSVGLGVMGLHGLYQALGMAWGSEAARKVNLNVFAHIKQEVDKANAELATERGPCPDALEVGIMDKRFSCALSIAPTASISGICGGATPGVEPSMANVFTQKTLSGSFTIENQYLQRVLAMLGKNTPEVWSSIALNEGSVQHLDFLTPEQKEVFKTAHEIDQMDIVVQAAERQPFICQAQSINLFILADVSKNYLHRLHLRAWELGVKTLYYCRSVSPKRAEKATSVVERVQILGGGCVDGVCEIPAKPPEPTYETCEACQ